MPNASYSNKPFWTHPIVLLAEEALVEDRYTVCMDIPYVRKSIWTQPIELLDDICHMKSHFNPFGDSVSLL